MSLPPRPSEKRRFTHPSYLLKRGAEYSHKKPQKNKGIEMKTEFCAFLWLFPPCPAATMAVFSPREVHRNENRSKHPIDRRCCYVVSDAGAARCAVASESERAAAEDSRR